MQYLLQSCPPSPAVQTPSSASRQNSSSSNSSSAATAVIMNQHMMTTQDNHITDNANQFTTPNSYHVGSSMGHTNHSGKHTYHNNNNNNSSSSSSSRMVGGIPMPAAPLHKSRRGPLNTAASDFLMNLPCPNQQQQQQQENSMLHNVGNSDSKGNAHSSCKALKKRLLLLHAPRKSSSGSLPFGEMRNILHVDICLSLLTNLFCMITKLQYRMDF